MQYGYGIMAPLIINAMGLRTVGTFKSNGIMDFWTPKVNRVMDLWNPKCNRVMDFWFLRVQ